MTAPRIVVAGGHSAGHIEPAMNFDADVVLAGHVLAAVATYRRHIENRIRAGNSILP